MEAGNPIISLFLAPNVFCVSPPPVSCGLMGEKVDELQRCTQGHGLRRDVQVQEAAAFFRRLLCPLLAQMTGIHIWRSEFSVSHFRPVPLCLCLFCRFSHVTASSVYT